MPPAKLTDTEKQELIALYRTTEATSVSLASQYGVSTATVSRILKQGLPADEYEGLMQTKRANLYRSSSAVAEPAPVVSEVIPEPEPELEPEPEIEPEPVAERAKPKPAKPEAPQRRQRKRSRSGADDYEGDSDTQLTLETAADSAEAAPAIDGFEVTDNAIKEILNEDIVSPAQGFEDDLEEDDDLDDDLDGDDDLDDDLDGDDDDEEDDDFDSGDDLGALGEFHIQTGALLQVLPLSEATIPRTFYLVVDRAAELITRPLKDFAELGQIPDEETLAKTLPIFDNHRVAKRFVRRSQRVVKVPDGKMLTKVSPYLQAKGITRLLIDGQVYSIEVDPVGVE